MGTTDLEIGHPSQQIPCWQGISDSRINNGFFLLNSLLAQARMPANLHKWPNQQNRLHKTQKHVWRRLKIIKEDIQTCLFMLYTVGRLCSSQSCSLRVHVEHVPCGQWLWTLWTMYKSVCICCSQAEVAIFLINHPTYKPSFLMTSLKDHKRSLYPGTKERERDIYI